MIWILQSQLDQLFLSAELVLITLLNIVLNPQINSFVAMLKRTDVRLIDFRAWKGGFEKN